MTIGNIYTNENKFLITPTTITNNQIIQPSATTTTKVVYPFSETHTCDTQPKDENTYTFEKILFINPAVFYDQSSSNYLMTPVETQLWPKSLTIYDSNYQTSSNDNIQKHGWAVLSGGNKKYISNNQETTRFNIINIGIPEANKFSSIPDNITYYTYEPVNANTYLDPKPSNIATKYTRLTQIVQTNARRVLLGGSNTFIQNNFDKSKLYYIEVSNVQPTIS